MLDSPANQEIVTLALSDHPQAFKDLLVAMDEFALVHETAAQENSGQEESETARKIRLMLEDL